MGGGLRPAHDAKVSAIPITSTTSITALGRPAVNCCSSGDDIDDPHHALVFVLEDVAVIHAQTGKLLTHGDANGFTAGHIDRVLPGSIGRLRDAIFPFDFDHLELRAMDVEGMIHVGRVLDFPELDLPRSHLDINAGPVEGLAVDHEGHGHAAGPAHRLAEDETASHCRLGELRDLP